MPYVPPPSLPLTGSPPNMTGRINALGITDTSTQFFGDQTPVNAISGTPDQTGVGYAPTNYPAGSTIGFCVASLSAPSGTAGSTFVLFQARNTSNGTNPMSTLQSLKFDAIHGSSGTITAVRGAQGTARSTGGATVTQLEGVSSQVFSTNSSAVTNGYTFFASSPSIASSGTIATAYGYYCNTIKVTGVTTGVAFFSNGASDVSMFAGSLAIGKTTAPSVTLDVSGTIALKVFTVATLPSASPAGQHSFVSDSTVAVAAGLGLAPIGGGGNTVPVYSDGAWKIG